MDKVTLLDKEMEFSCRFAAPSILTGYFVAAVLNSSREIVEAAFDDPGRILVQSVEKLYRDKIYEGYTRINEIRENAEEIIVLLDKEERNE